MEKAKLIIKYKNEYILDNTRNELNFISVPLYNGNSCFMNIDIFIILLCYGYLDDNFGATRGFNYCDGLELFEHFDPNYIKEIDKNTFIYDLDEELADDPKLAEICEKNLKKLPSNLESHSYEEIKKISKNNNYNDNSDNEDEPFIFDFSIPRVDDTLLGTLNAINAEKTDKDVLLLYSGGKDSTLAAIRLHNAGYNIHFIHFDNGAMKDADKPYLTFKNTFGQRDGYYFDYQLHSYDISENFKLFFEKWVEKNGDILENGSIDSEIRCMCCRMAMYVDAICIAKSKGFKYIAEGARISQEFMIEQQPMIERLKELAKSYGIELIFPVLTLEDDNEEKQELIENGFSSKGWESKCLLGREPMFKRLKDEERILTYYDEMLKPKILRIIDRKTNN